MSLFVKICGLCRAEDVAAAAALNPDAVGFVFWPGSSRCVRPADVGVWTEGLPEDIERVGVFVDAPAPEIRDAARIAGLTIVQLHGRESPDLCRVAWPRAWKALSIASTKDEALTPYPVEAIVLDSGSAAMPGGTGRAGDWDAAAEFVAESAVPVVLAGGLTAENVARAVDRVRPWGVDVSSGVEQAPGRKDAGLLREFIERCREL